MGVDFNLGAALILRTTMAETPGLHKPDRQRSIVESLSQTRTMEPLWEAEA